MNNWLLCLKHGTKYNSEYVNKLYSMTKRNSTVPFQFACITEDPSGLHPDIVIIPIPNYPLYGWWFKVWTLSDELPISGNILFMDLDVVIINNIDHIWNYNTDKFTTIRDFIRYINPDCKKINSSVFQFQSHQYSYVWDKLKEDFNQIFAFHGDQDWIHHVITEYAYFPDSWIRSYKWEIRQQKDLVRIDNSLVFSTVQNPEIDPDTTILVFHGEPNPESVQDPIIISNWR